MYSELPGRPSADAVLADPWLTPPPQPPHAGAALNGAPALASDALELVAPFVDPGDGTAFLPDLDLVDVAGPDHGPAGDDWGEFLVCRAGPGPRAAGIREGDVIVRADGRRLVLARPEEALRDAVEAAPAAGGRLSRAAFFASPVGRELGDVRGRDAFRRLVPEKDADCVETVDPSGCQVGPVLGEALAGALFGKYNSLATLVIRRRACGGCGAAAGGFVELEVVCQRIVDSELPAEMLQTPERFRKYLLDREEPQGKPRWDRVQAGGSADLGLLELAFGAWQAEHEAGPTWGLRDVLAQWRRRGLVVREPDTDAYHFVHGKWT